MTAWRFAILLKKMCRYEGVKVQRGECKYLREKEGVKVRSERKGVKVKELGESE